MEKGPYRLAWSRTSPFHGENGSSNLPGDANFSPKAKIARYSFVCRRAGTAQLLFYALRLPHQIYKVFQRKYIGQTDDIVRRLSIRNSGGSIFTKDFWPWKLEMFLKFKSKQKAIECEKYLKSGAGRAFANILLSHA